MTRPLESKLAIITGASRGFGAALAQHLASKGANIVINYASESSTATATTLAQELELQHSVRTLLARADITTPDGPTQLIDAAKSAFSNADGFQIDTLVNNAGIVNPAPMGSVTLSDFEATFTLNARAPLFVLQAALPYLPNDRSGRVINVSSITTSMGFW